jgi:hypothetical protein
MKALTMHAQDMRIRSMLVGGLMVLSEDIEEQSSILVFGISGRLVINYYKCRAQDLICDDPAVTLVVRPTYILYFLDTRSESEMLGNDTSQNRPNIRFYSRELKGTNMPKSH